ncbi:hypothetical protein D9V37_10125 [Nocardioides mangrovicus]|uniref:Uncharacterized protein n=1 Tax=Nocardioides mangrovicus TaxID=2478913 RepID=A0A3L8P1N5_9ACTN|nr:hypothetical protein [Nocardioides mangrovicus]RLV48941.1 hypothetical protein D9V37_10125 [Nocardioides mangrovicus]
MTSSFAPPAGDAAALASRGRQLGESAAALAGQTAQVQRGAGLVQVALLQSNSALRIDELRKGIRGIDHEVELLRRTGEEVADIVRDRAAALQHLTADLERLREQARSEPDRRPLLEIQADFLRDDHRCGDHRAAARIEHLTERLRISTTPTPRSRNVLAGADTTLTAAWTQLSGAYESIAEQAHRADQASVAYQLMGFFEGLGDGVTGTVHDLRDLVGHPGDAASGLLHFVNALITHPIRTSDATRHALTDPYTDDWKDHEYGRAVGRGTEALAELVFGAKGATKVGKVVREAVTSRRAATVAHVWSSQDPHVGDLANWLDSTRPGTVKHVNNWIPMHDGTLREVDIDLGSTVIQVKSGNARRLLAQMSRTRDSSGRHVLAYAPSLPDGAYAHALRNGFAVARTKQDLLNLIKEFA